MLRDKKIVQLAKALVKLSKEDGRVTDGAVRAVLDALKKSPSRRYGAILKAYLRLIRREVALQTATIQSAGALTPESIQAVEKVLSERYGRSITATTLTEPSLIAGVRIRVGDDVIDASVAGSLERFAAQVH